MQEHRPCFHASGRSGNGNRTAKYRETVTELYAKFVSDLPEILRGKEVYWIGPRESDMRDAVDFPFARSITQFGSGIKTGTYTNYAMCSNVSHPERVDHNDANDLEQPFLVLHRAYQPGAAGLRRGIFHPVAEPAGLHAARAARRSQGPPGAGAGRLLFQLLLHQK